MSSLLPSPILTMDLTSEMLRHTHDLSVLKRSKKNDSAGDMAKRMLLLISLLGIRIRDAANVFGAAEILLLILSYCDFPTVMSVSRTNRHGRRVGQTLVRDRFRMVLAPYVPSAQFGSFIELLQATGSGVTGSVVRQLLALQSNFALVPTYDSRLRRTSNLNVIAARGQFQACKQWFVNAGYVNWTEKLVPGAYKEYLIGAWEGEKPVEVGSSENPKVIIAHARTNIIDTVIGAPLTTQTNLITGSFIYSLWPNLICKRDAIRTDIPYVPGLRRSNRNWPIQLSNAYWKEACGKYCPSRERAASDDNVTASFAWNAGAPPAWDGTRRMDDVWNGRLYVYRFLKKCRNTQCKNYSSSRQAYPL